MADGSHIEWTDATWQPITGCSIVSPGCTNCYAMKLAGTRLKHHPSRAGLTQDTKAGPVWTGEVRFNEQWLDQPLRWSKPRRIFVCAHGDLFAEGVPDAWIDLVFAVMALAPQHTFQVLTKRAERMLAYMTDGQSAARRISNIASGTLIRWPLPQVWLGVSVEDQTRADERIPLLLDTPAAVRFISAEPLLSAVDLTRLCIVPQKPGSIRAGIHVDALRNKHSESGLPRGLGRLDWIICGGESGPGARPMHPEWARSLRDQCQAAGAAFHFKQWGEWHPCECFEEGGPCYPMPGHEPFNSWKAPMFDPDGREVGWHWRRLGKRAAGRLLDGIEHNEFPGMSADDDPPDHREPG